MLEENSLSRRLERMPTTGLEDDIEPDEWVEQMKRSEVYRYGLIDDAFLNGPLMDDSRAFLNELEDDLAKRRFQGEESFIGELMQKGILTREDFERHVIAPHGIDAEAVANLFELRAPEIRERCLALADKGILSPFTLWNQVAIDKRSFFNTALYERDEAWWNEAIASGLMKPETINVLNPIGLDAVEVEALQNDLIGSSKTQDYPLDPRAHPLAQKMRAQEHTKKISKQVDKALGESVEGEEIMGQFSRVFDAYLVKTPMYQKLRAIDSIPPEERETERLENIHSVNSWQANALKLDPDVKYKFVDADKRFFDLYARYGYEGGHMDPFQLAIIARAAHWYIMEGRSRLFNAVRVVPFNPDRRPERIPSVALAACPGAQLLSVTGSDFKSSLYGANRTYLTHSYSRDSSSMYSIPVVGLATWANPVWKVVEDDNEVVIFNADFDPQDRIRGGNWKERPGATQHKDVAGDIAGLINETLRVLVELEDKEIRRANPNSGSRSRSELANPGDDGGSRLRKALRSLLGV